MRTANASNREKFLRAAVDELHEQGIAGFSLRRVAKRCNVTCAAPYKHFEDKNDLIVEMIKYINAKWTELWKSTVDAHKDESLEDQIIAVCMAYLTYLCTYPEYQTVLFMNDRGFPPEALAEKGRLSGESERLVREYCKTVNMPEDVARRKTATVRSILYGSAILISSGELSFSSDTFDMIRSNIRREFRTE